MSKFILVTLTVLAVGTALIAPAKSESLWQPQAAKSPYIDKTAARLGDIVTVVIVESAASSQQASTDAKKNSSLNTGPGVGPGLQNIPLFKYSGGDSVNASGSTTRTSSLSAKMTAKVTKVEANGNLVIEGSRFVQTNKEKAEMKLTGTIRPQDIAVDNTVLSTYISDAKITYVGSGPIGSRQKEGLISKIFKILF